MFVCFPTYFSAAEPRCPNLTRAHYFGADLTRRVQKLLHYCRVFVLIFNVMSAMHLTAHGTSLRYLKICISLLDRNVGWLEKFYPLSNILVQNFTRKLVNVCSYLHQLISVRFTMCVVQAFADTPFLQILFDTINPRYRYFVCVRAYKLCSLSVCAYFTSVCNVALCFRRQNVL